MLADRGVSLANSLGVWLTEDDWPEGFRTGVRNVVERG